ncbi:histone-like nucleoid-structuring protein Lsr2 [Streptomyces collinus]|uniref:Lsr2 dimerization domain-containing protein n=1 Tax=Streptomyces collinus TaxID=42684 RepID=UPI00369402DC
MGRFGWCLTGHHKSCPVETVSGLQCDCRCHIKLEALENAILHHQVDSEVETVNFAIDGSEYEVVITKIAASELRESLAPFMRVARQVGV